MKILIFFQIFTNRFGGALTSVPASNAIDRVFESRSGQTKDYIKLVLIVSSLLSTLH